MEHDPTPFTRAPSTGKRIAVVGAGPAGLACAHRLALRGHDITVFEARDKPGGLNEYGIAAYKLADDFAQREVEFVRSVGGIAISYGKRLGRDFDVKLLREEFAAVFLAIGQEGVRALGIEGETLAGVRNAVDFIADLRQASDKATLPVGRRVVVIGGGNTAIDAATQARRLGAEDVTIVYRRGTAEMSATVDEQAWAQTNDVRIRHWATPHRLLGEDGHVTGIEFLRTKPDQTGRAVPTGETYVLPADMVLKAVGQVFVADPLHADGSLTLAVEGGRIAVDAQMRTSLPGVYAGGDCVAGVDLTVAAVQDGKRAAEAIHAALMR
jgi:glutamate synthase (NADPH/NADH) small chain